MNAFASRLPRGVFVIDGCKRRAIFLASNQEYMNSLLRVSGRNHAGLILMAELANRHAGDEYLTLQSVAEDMHISLAYLEEIALGLKQAGLIEGRKGPGGGYRLAQAPDRISMENILVALEGPVAMVDCQDSDKACPVESKCSTKSLWNFLHKNVITTLRKTSLSDVVCQSL